MATDFKVIVGANLFCDEDPDESNHIALDQVALPDLNRMMEEHNPGGSFMALEVDMEQFEALTLPFTLKGVSESMLARVGYGTNATKNYTVFKDVKNVKTGTRQRLTCVVRGILASAQQDAYNKRGLSGFDYEVKGIQSYRLTLGKNDIYDFDLFANRCVVNGRDQLGQSNSILGIG